MSTQNASKNLPISSEETRLQKIARRRRKKTIRKETFSAAISLENFNTANFCNAQMHTKLLEKHHVERYLPLEQVSFFFNGNWKNQASNLLAWFSFPRVPSRIIVEIIINLFEIRRRNRKKRHRDKLRSRGTDYSRVTQKWAKHGHANRVTRGRLIDILLASLTAHARPRKNTHTHACFLFLFLSVFLSEN